MDCVDCVRVHHATDDEEKDPEQDHKDRNSVHEVLDFSGQDTTALDVVNGPKASIPAARHIRNDASARRRGYHTDACFSASTPHQDSFERAVVPCGNG